MLQLNSMIKNTLLYFTLLLLPVSIIAQNSILENFPFAEGGYTMLGKATTVPTSMEWKDSMEYWYVEDIKLLQQFKKELIFPSRMVEVTDSSRCHISICKAGKSLAYFNMKIDLDQLNTKQYLNPNKFKPAVFKTVSFDTLSAARTYLNTIFADQNLLCVDNPDLLQFEGSFIFEYNCLDEFGGCFGQQEKIIAFLTEKINRAYPNEPFELAESGGTKVELFVQVKCNYSLSEKFDLYYRVNDISWTPYSLRLNSFWKE